MLRCSRILAVVALLSLAAGCESRRRSAAGFHLPANGDPEQGRIAFVTLGCTECHDVAGMKLARPQPQPLTTVVLGGDIDWQITDGYLATSLIDPSYRIAPQPREPGAANVHMRNHDQMTIRQLVDIVAFLQAHYRPVSLPARGVYY